LQGTGPAPWYDQPMYFNGTSGNMTVKDSADIRLTAYTLSLWVYLPGAQNEYWKGLGGKPGRNFNIWLGNANGQDGPQAGYIRHHFHTTNGGAYDLCSDTGYVITWNVWHHVVITNNGTTCATYVDGGLADTPLTLGSPLVMDPGPIYFATNLDCGCANFLNGYLDEIQLYNRALSPTEVLSLKQNDNVYKAYYRDSTGAYTQLALTDAIGSGDVNDANPAVWKTAATYADNDRDTFGQAATGNQNVGSTASVGYSLDNTDCLDSDATKYRYLTGYQDSDGDGVTTGGPQNVCSGATLPAGWRAAPNGNDCLDSNPALYQYIFGYRDADGDGRGNAATGQNVCSGASLPAGWVSNNTDCNDGTPALYQNIFGYQDADGDGYGNPATGQNVCSGASLPAGWVSNGTDCADNNGYAYQVVGNLFFGDYDHDLFDTGILLNQPGCVGPATWVNTIWGGTWFYMVGDGSYSAEQNGLGRDCFDGNVYANPWQSGYFTTNRGDGSFDWNCDGVSTPGNYGYKADTLNKGLPYCSGTTTGAGDCGVYNNYCTSPGGTVIADTLSCH
jgi:hypothetical protein